MEQVMAAVNAVREGKGINVSEQRTQELIEQFSQEPPKPEGEMPKFDDVALWPDLAEAWLKSLKYKLPAATTHSPEVHIAI